ncbi:MAG TPA: hypothetical protein VGK02_04625 [Candidatus Aquicultor sp.]|jgi:hypothetical protein
MASHNGAGFMIKNIAVIITLGLAILASSAGSAVAITSQRDWTSLQTPHFIIFATKRANMRSIGQTAESIYIDMAGRYHFEQQQKIKLYVYTDRAAFLSDSPSDNAAGYAAPGQNLVSILNGVGNATITLTHEINHIIFMRSVPRIDTVPEWFIEGLATYESQPGVDVANLDSYMLTRDIPQLVGNHSNSGWAGSQQDYAQAYQMVSFVADKFGRNKLYGAIDRMQAGEDFDTALLRAVGRNQKQLNSDWQGYARKQQITIWLIWLQDIGWYVMGVLVLLLAIWAPIRKHLHLRRMEEDEVPESLEEIEARISEEAGEP